MTTVNNLLTFSFSSSAIFGDNDEFFDTWSGSLFVDVDTPLFVPTNDVLLAFIDFTFEAYESNEMK